jgi:hypothetical protein
MLRCLSFFFLLLLTVPVNAQQEERDSSFLYKKIEAFADKRKFTRMIYRSVFRPVTPHPVPVKKTKKAIKNSKSLSSYEGRVIRNIHVVTYDPFGYDSKDTSITPYAFFPRAGNALHIKTLPMKIRNILIIKKYDTFDSLRVKESERLIRSQSFIREAYITPVLKNDSVDLYIRVYDVWSIIVIGDLSPSTFKVDVRDKNFLGSGHQFRNKFKQNYLTGKNSDEINYYIPNIYNTYINSTFHYYIDENRNYNESFSLFRPFYSVFTSWAGGVSVQQKLNREILVDFDGVPFTQVYKVNSQDLWVGRSWQIFKGRSEELRSTSFISSARYLRDHYVQRAEKGYDSLNLHPNQDFYLVGAGVARRQYKQDNYIFRYGYVEDVPIGRAYSIVGGYQIKENIPRWYFGSRVYMANYHSWGYFNIYFEYGTFVRKSIKEEGSFLAGINYFSNIIPLGRWKLRQFIKPQFIIGFNRKKTDNLSLNDDGGIRGFNSTGLKGTQKMVLTFQLQSYAPWNVLGFRFGPYIVCSFGMLGTEKNGFNRSPVYSSFGIGLLIKNEYLIINTFQISLAYFPFIPGAKNSVFKVNPVKTSDFGFRGFDIEQPATISYQ